MVSQSTCDDCHDETIIRLRNADGFVICPSCDLAATVAAFPAFFPAEAEAARRAERQRAIRAANIDIWGSAA